MIHKIVLWPFKLIDGWLKRHYQSKQMNELIAIQQRQSLRDSLPDLDVSVKLIGSPVPPRVRVIIENYGGKTKLLQGKFRIAHSNDPAYKDEKYLTDLEMPKGKKEEFFLPIKLVPYGQIVQGHSLLKFEYELHFYGPNQQPEERKGAYHYDAHIDDFVMD